MRAVLGRATLFFEPIDAELFMPVEPFINCRSADSVFLRKISDTKMSLRVVGYKLGF